MPTRTRPTLNALDKKILDRLLRKEYSRILDLQKEFDIDTEFENEAFDLFEEELDNITNLRNKTGV